MSSKIISYFKVSTENIKIQQPKLQAFIIHKCKLCTLSKT